MGTMDKVMKLFELTWVSSFLMREASSKRVCPSVRQSVSHTPLQICKMQKNMHVLSARDFDIFVCRIGYVSENSLDIDSGRDFNCQLSTFFSFHRVLSSRIT